MSHYPHGNFYETLYKRYFDDDKMSAFMQVGGDLTGKKVMDLCGGTGRLATLISKRYPSADVILVDESSLMPDTYSGKKMNVTVAELFANCDMYAEDVIFCQQAINYWFNQTDIERLFRSLNPGGSFIFNTFNKCPTVKPVSKNYDIDGVSFLEVSWYAPDTNLVHHVQIREGMPSHATSFKWISKSEFVNVLAKVGFYVDVIERGASLTVKAVKPGF